MRKIPTYFLLRTRGVPLFLLIYVVRNRFKKLVASLDRKVNEVVDFAFSFRDNTVSIEPIQRKEEISELLRLIEKNRPRVVLEIGTAKGGTLFLFCEFSDPKATVVSVDLPAGYPKWKIPLYQSFAGDEQSIHLIRSDSHDRRTLEKIRVILGGRPIDFLFVDGDHTYEGVKQDFMMYGPLVRNGGLIAFHDIIAGPPELAGEVHRFWEEVKENFKYIEFVKNRDGHAFGIGVIYI